jgi:hypothetical protein
MSKTTMTNDNSAQLNVRLANELLERVERHRARLEVSVPGLSITRVDAIRALLVEALDRAEATENRAS